MDPYREAVVARLAELLDRSRVDDLPETLWMTALTMLERSTERTRNWHWWRSNPAGELRKVRAQVAEALALARFAAQLQEADNAGEWAADRDGRDLRSAERARLRRRQTMPAELARLANAAARKAAREPARNPPAG